MKAYISVSYSGRKLTDKALIAITSTLHEFKIEPFIFVDNYNFSQAQEKQLMNQAIADIENCDLLIAETTDKAIGVGIEAGYAKAKYKPVIYLRQKDAAHSTTLSGLSDFQIIYEDADDLKIQLSSAIKEILTKK
jgi:2'-deoxynucleoside 5'-phosphate N-hydrolase